MWKRQFKRMYQVLPALIASLGATTGGAGCASPQVSTNLDSSVHGQRPAGSAWPIAQVRIARPTDRLKEVVRFYHDGLGLPIIGSFSGHAGYSGVMLGLPGSTFHLEFTQFDGGSPGQAPSRDNLLVLYIPQRAERERLASQLHALGYPQVAPENPYWEGRSVTIADPDGWRVVLFDGRYVSDQGNGAADKPDRPM
jgi:hypothetical protein